MKTRLLLASLFLSMAGLSAQTYQVPVSEQDEPMMKGKFEPTWSLSFVKGYSGTNSTIVESG